MHNVNASAKQPMKSVRIIHRRVLLLALILVSILLLGYMYTSLGVLSRLMRDVRFIPDTHLFFS